MQIRTGLLALLWLATSGGWLATAGHAAEAPPPEQTPAAEGEEEAAEERAAEAGESVGGQMGEVSLDRFIPSEEISADGAVSFPVDI